MLVEMDGPGGLYTELGRTCSVGPAPGRLIEELAVCLEAQRFTVDLLRSGARCAWICDNWPDGPGERLRRFPQEIVEL